MRYRTLRQSHIPACAVWMKYRNPRLNWILNIWLWIKGEKTQRVDRKDARPNLTEETQSVTTDLSSKAMLWGCISNFWACIDRGRDDMGWPKCVNIYVLPLFMIYIPPGRCRPELYHITNCLGFLWGLFRVHRGFHLGFWVFSPNKNRFYQGLAPSW